MHFFTPGRTEIIGNHTDHQMGRVIAAAVNVGISADCEKSEDTLVRVFSPGFGEICVDISDKEPRDEERETTAALIRGVAAALERRGFATGGFSGSISSCLQSGGGLSSSAAFSVLMGRVFNTFYNDGAIDARTLAECAQEAENRHFGKPSGLMDQLACALGGAVYIDFLRGETESLECDFGKMGLVLCLTNTGGSHAGLTEDYASIPADMCAAAAVLGEKRLGYANRDELFAKMPAGGIVRRRAEHFFEENERVVLMKKAIEEADGEECMRLMNLSGRSSEEKLMNIISPMGDTRLDEGLRLSRKLLEGRGAWRVHGGGFAGCVQALMPEGIFEEYRAAMDAYFGDGSCVKVM